MVHFKNMSINKVGLAYFELNSEYIMDLKIYLTINTQLSKYPAYMMLLKVLLNSISY